MLLSLDKKHAFCHNCKEWLKIGVDTFFLINETGYSEYDEIRCLGTCEPPLGTLLGFRKDIEWL